VLVLAFDTATPAVTVAVGSADRVIAQETTIDARRQGELLAVSIRKVLADAGVAATDLDAIVAGAGPGPYTGLRVGLVTARVLGSALGVRVHGVCTLDVIAADAVPAAAGTVRLQTGGTSLPVLADRVTTAWCESFARALARRDAAVGPAGPAPVVPAVCRASELLPAGAPAEVRQRWDDDDGSAPLALSFAPASLRPLSRGVSVPPDSLRYLSSSPQQR